jgi:hypothetical protein
VGGRRWRCRWSFAAKYFYPALGINLLHETFILFFASLRLCFVALHAGDIIGVVDIPGLFAKEMAKTAVLASFLRTNLRKHLLTEACLKMVEP